MVCLHLALYSRTASSQFTTFKILIQKHGLELLENSLPSKKNYVYDMEAQAN